MGVSAILDSNTHVIIMKCVCVYECVNLIRQANETYEWTNMSMNDDYRPHKHTLTVCNFHTYIHTYTRTWLLFPCTFRAHVLSLYSLYYFFFFSSYKQTPNYFVCQQTFLHFMLFPFFSLQLKFVQTHIHTPENKYK